MAKKNQKTMKVKHRSTENLLKQIDDKKIPPTPDLLQCLITNRLIELLSYKRKDGTTLLD